MPTTHGPEFHEERVHGTRPSGPPSTVHKPLCGTGGSPPHPSSPKSQSWKAPAAPSPRLPEEPRAERPPQGLLPRALQTRPRLLDASPSRPWLSTLDPHLPSCRLPVYLPGRQAARLPGCLVPLPGTPPSLRALPPSAPPWLGLSPVSPEPLRATQPSRARSNAGPVSGPVTAFTCLGCQVQTPDCGASAPGRPSRGLQPEVQGQGGHGIFLVGSPLTRTRLPSSSVLSGREARSLLGPLLMRLLA